MPRGRPVDQTHRAVVDFVAYAGSDSRRVPPPQTWGRLRAAGRRRARPQPRRLAGRHAFLGQLFVERAELRNCPLLSNVASRIAHHHQGRAFPEHTEGDANPVLGLGVLDARLHGSTSLLESPSAGETRTS